MTDFSTQDVLSPDLLAQVTEVRLHRAAEVREFARARARREALTTDGKLVILAADHPARMVTGALGDPLALADRREYLGRILRVIKSGHVDGLMGTPDIIEEILILDLLGGGTLTGKKLLIGCMNRGGLAGTAFEMLDSFTAYDARGLAEMNLDGAKLMFRLDPEDPASGQTITWCADAINECLERELTVFLEPLLVKREGRKYPVQKDLASMRQVCSVAAALGRSSLNTWLKMPYCEGYAQVAAGTTCPILMLGGEAAGDPRPLLRDIEQGMRAAANVRGVLIGRNVLFPGEADPARVAGAIWAVVHEGATAEAAWGGEVAALRGCAAPDPA